MHYPISHLRREVRQSRNVAVAPMPPKNLKLYDAFVYLPWLADRFTGLRRDWADRQAMLSDWFRTYTCFPMFVFCAFPPEL